MLRSEANLMASLTAPWSPEAMAAARMILARISAEETARTSREVRAVLSEDAEGLVAEARERFQARAFPSATPGLRTFHCPLATVGHLADWLLRRGASQVAVAPLDYVFAAQNTLFEALSSKLAQVGAG